MACNTTASLDKLIWTDNVEFGHWQDRLEQFCCSRTDCKYLDVKLKVFKKDDNKKFRLVEIPTMGEADFNQFTRWRDQLVIAAENFGREENLSTLLIPTTSKDMNEQFKPAHKVVDVVDRANRKICVFLLRCSVDEP